MNTGTFPGIDQALEEALAARAMPGAAVAFGRTGQSLYLRVLGCATLYPTPQPLTAATLFDLASLTKVLATTLLCMRLCQAGRLDLDRPLGDYLPKHYPPDKARLSLRLLLAHAAGLPAHVPFYKERDPHPSDPAAQRREVLEKVRHAPLEAAPATRALYSDLGFMLVGELLEECTGRRLDHLFAQEVATRLNLSDTFFVHLDDPLPLAQRPATAFAATEQCPWRGLLLRGQVHDENAFLLRGVAGHAGMFSTIIDLERLALLLLEIAAGQSAFLSRATLETFIRRAELVPGSSRALGWDTPSTGASCGQFLSPAAFGHTGFTGTSLWLDPARDLYVVLLSNRVHPRRENQAFLRFRPRLHDRIVQSLENSPSAARATFGTPPTSKGGFGRQPPGP